MPRVLLLTFVSALVGSFLACSDSSSSSSSSATGDDRGTGGGGGDQSVTTTSSATTADAVSTTGASSGGGAPACDTQNDPMNCGQCGNVCGLGLVCNAGVCGCGTSSVSFSQSVQPILTANCAKSSCHKGSNPKEHLDLTEAHAHAGLVGAETEQCKDGRMRVAPYDPGASYIVQKLLKVDVCEGKRMPPPTVGSLEDAEIATIVTWICAGAPDN